MEKEVVPMYTQDQLLHGDIVSRDRCDGAAVGFLYVVPNWNNAIISNYTIHNGGSKNIAYQNHMKYGWSLGSQEKLVLYKRPKTKFDPAELATITKDSKPISLDTLPKPAPLPPLKPIKWEKLKPNKDGFLWLTKAIVSNSTMTPIPELSASKYNGHFRTHDTTLLTIPEIKTPGPYGITVTITYSLQKHGEAPTLADCGYGGMYGLDGLQKQPHKIQGKYFTEGMENYGNLLCLHSIEKILCSKAYILFSGKDGHEGIGKIYIDIAKASGSWIPVNNANHGDGSKGAHWKKGTSARGQHLGVITHHGLYKYYKSPEFKALKLMQ